MRRLNTTWILLALLPLLGSSEAVAQRRPFTWDIPKVVEAVDVPGVMMANGIPVRIRAVRSSEKPEALLQHIVNRFEQWGFFLAPIETQAQPFREPQLTALDSDQRVSYTAIFQPHPDGTTTVFLGEANLSQPPVKQSPFAPVYPGARDLVHTDVEVARSLSYSVSAKPADVHAFYRRELGKQAYTQVEPDLYRNGAEELRVMVRASQGARSSVVVMRRAVLPDPSLSADAEGPPSTPSRAP